VVQDLVDQEASVAALAVQAALVDKEATVAALVVQEVLVAVLVVQEVLADQVSVVAMVDHMDILIKTASKHYFF
jgi:hypothetical protein